METSMLLKKNKIMIIILGQGISLLFKAISGLAILLL